MGVRIRAVAGIAAIAAAVPLVVLGQPGVMKALTTELNRPWPAPVKADEPEQPPVLSPEEAMKTFYMAPGYQLELVAAEPLVKDPILSEFDGDGRLWVLEMEGFAINEKMDNSFEPINQLVVLEDTNDDGVYDKRTVFMDKLIMPRAFKVLDKNCALVGEPPNLWKACDTDGDLKSDTKELLDQNFATQGVVEHGANGLYWGMDNTLVVSEHNYNVKVRAGGKFEIVPSLRRAQWGVTQDDAGRIFRNVNTDPLFVDYVAPDYYARNPNLVRTTGLYENLVDQEKTHIWPIHPTFGLNRGYRREVFRPDGTASYYGGVSSPMIYRGDALPQELYGQPLVVDGPTNIVHLLRLKDDGAGRLSAEDYYEKGEFLASTDERFRPVSMAPGWDGTFYIVDMYRGVSQDGPLQTDYLKDYIAKRRLWDGIKYGRIYRVVHESMKTGAKKPQMSKDTPAQLVAHLSHPNGWWRDTAQQLLVQRNDKSVVPALTRLATNAPDWRTRLHAMWTLDGMEVLPSSVVMKALNDQSPDVRAAGVRLSSKWLGDRRMKAAVLKRMDDSSWTVRRQLAATLGELPADQRMAPILTVLEKYGDDPVTVDVAISSLPGQEMDALTQLIRQKSPSMDAVTQLAAATGKRRDVAATQTLVDLATDTARPAAVRLALLQGVTQGLRGEAAGPGNVVAGGRAGGGIPGVNGRRTASAQVELPAAPAALTRIAGESGDMADSAKEVLALVTWPGKPPPPAAAPRTAEEEKLFVAGRQIYLDNCSGCHLPEGRGAGALAADLAGSKHVNGTPDVPVRILINGKEGALGLMPPAGAGMSDIDLAAVVTYIRGSWGNTGAPVTPAGVKEWRQSYAHRDTPWTEAELAIRRR